MSDVAITGPESGNNEGGNGAAGVAMPGSDSPSNDAGSDADDAGQRLEFEDLTKTYDAHHDTDGARLMDRLNKIHDGEVSSEGLKTFAASVKNRDEMLDIFSHLEAKNKYNLTDLEALKERLRKIEELVQPAQVNGDVRYNFREQLELGVYKLLGWKEKQVVLETTVRRRTSAVIAKSRYESMSKEGAAAKGELERLEGIVEKEEKELVNLSTNVAQAKTQMIAYHASMDQLDRAKEDAQQRLRQACEMGNYREANKEKETIKRIDNDRRIFYNQEQQLGNIIQVDAEAFVDLRAETTALREVQGLYQGIHDQLDLAVRRAQRDVEGGVYLNTHELIGKIEKARDIHEDIVQSRKRRAGLIGALDKGPSSGNLFRSEGPLLASLKTNTDGLLSKQRVARDDRYTSALGIAEEIESQAYMF
ncbi:MAG: hypothetical protein Q7R96_01610 [Nanoarchaeota archaeon]|nr:hypothetical protein [Nanoarchaeota archaeon]